MKNEIKGYLSKSNLKNFNSFYKDYHKVYSKRNLTLFSKSQKPYYFYEKKNILPLTTMSGGIKYSSLKDMNKMNNKKNDFNLKFKLKQKLKHLLKPPANLRNSSRNLKLGFNCSNTFTLEGDNTTNCFMNFVNDYEKDFFSDSAYLNLQYNENEIYKGEEYYDNYIKEKINYLKSNKIHSKIKHFEKNFCYGKYKKEINLTFNSLQITFKNMSMPNEGEDKSFYIDFPFELLPIFYYKGIDAFIKFLSRIIIIENHFENVVFEEDKIIEEFNKLKDYKTDKEEEINDSDNSLNLDINNRKSNEKDDKIIDLMPHNLNKNSSYLKFNNFIFFWITNAKTYIVTVKLPCIHLNILENNIKINHYINYELLFYLYKKKFVNWEFYIIKYLSSYSKFRNIFQQISFHSKINNKTFFLKEPKQKINTFSQEILINIYIDQFNNNSLLIFKSFYINALITDVFYNLEKKYHIHFNFFHYIKLYEIAKYSSKLFFLIKFLTINKEFNTLNFNYEEFDKFNIKTWMSNIHKYSKKSLILSDLNEELYTEFDIFPKNIQVEFVRPKYSLLKFENNKEVMKTLEIGKDLEKELVDSIVDSGSESWTKFLNECLQKLNEPVPILPAIHHKKTFKKKESKKLKNISVGSNKEIRKRFSKLFK